MAHSNRARYPPKPFTQSVRELGNDYCNVGITVIYSPWCSYRVSSLDFATKWTIEEDTTGEPQFDVLQHPLLLMFLLKREWNQFCLDSMHLYKKVTELLMGNTALLSTAHTYLQIASTSWWAAAEMIVGINAACTAYLQVYFESTLLFGLELGF